jgi:hypothetical protein
MMRRMAAVMGISLGIIIIKAPLTLQNRANTRAANHEYLKICLK